MDTNTTNTEEFYKRLQEQLEKDTTWPAFYLYKFIVPTSDRSVAQIEEAFDGMDATIQTRDSSSKKFTSVSIKVMMQSPQAVVDKYIEMSAIEGIISL